MSALSNQQVRHMYVVTGASSAAAPSNFTSATTGQAAVFNDLGAKTAGNYAYFLYKNNKKDAKAPFLLIIFCMNFKVCLWMITYWTNIRCFFTNNDMSTVTTFPNLYFTFSENFLHFYIM